MAYRRLIAVAPPTRGMGCACGGVSGCGCSGLGQATSISQVGSDVMNLAADVFENSDGTINWVAVAFAGAVGLLVFRNWGHTTSHTTRRKK